MAQESGVSNPPDKGEVSSTASAFDPKAPFGSATADQIFVPSIGYVPVPRTQGAAPQLPATPRSQGGGGDLLQMLASLGGGITEQDLKRAIMPSQAVPASSQMPGYFGRQLTPLPPVNYVPADYSTPGQPRQAGITNAITGTIGMLAQFKRRQQENQMTAEATKVASLLQAQQGMMQAKAMLAMPGLSPQQRQMAQESLDHNSKLMGGMLEDKKFRTSVEKGFQISLTDPSQNKTPDHNIVQKGLDLFRKRQQQTMTPQQAQQIGQQAAQRFMSQRPEMLAPNMVEQQMLQARLAAQKEQSGILRSVLPALIRGEYQQRALKDTFSRAQWLAQFREQNQNARAWAKTLNDWDVKRAEWQQQKDIRMLGFDLANRHLEYALSMAAMNPAKARDAREKYAVDTEKMLSDRSNYVQNLIAQRDAYQKSQNIKVAKEGSELWRMDQEIYTEQQKTKTLEDARIKGLANADAMIEGLKNVTIPRPSIPTSDQPASGPVSGGAGAQSKSPTSPAPTGGAEGGIANQFMGASSIEEINRLLHPEADIYSPPDDEPEPGNEPDEQP